MRARLGHLVAAAGGLVAAPGLWAGCQSVEIEIVTVVPDLGDCPLREPPIIDFRTGDCEGDDFQRVDGQPVIAGPHCFRARAYTQCGQVWEARQSRDLAIESERAVRLDTGVLEDAPDRRCEDMRLDGGLSLAPLQLAPVTSVLAAGSLYACGLVSDAETRRLEPRCWGQGALGEASESAVAVGGITDLSSVAVARETRCSLESEISLTCSGVVPGWLATTWSVPLGAGGVAARIRQVAVGGQLVCVSVERGTENLQGEVWCWSAPALGRDWRACSGGEPCQVLERVGGAFQPRAPVVSDLCAGERHACALIEGAVYCFGDGEQLGAAPQPVSLPSPATALACGAEFTCATVFDPSSGPAVWCWGDATSRQLGRARGGSPAQICVAPG